MIARRTQNLAGRLRRRKFRSAIMHRKRVSLILNGDSRQRRQMLRQPDFSLVKKLLLFRWKFGSALFPAMHAEQANSRNLHTLPQIGQPPPTDDVDTRLPPARQPAEHTRNFRNRGAPGPGRP